MNKLTAPRKLSKPRLIRLLGGILLPPLLGALLIFVPVILFNMIATTSTGKNWQDIVSGIFIAILFAYIFAGLQSLVASLLMEFVVNPKARRDGLAVSAGGFFGLLSVLPLASGLVFLPVGLIVGLLVGWWLRKSHNREFRKAA